eukprot:NODE_351_length_2365_cov_46.875782_g328_i0.p1 GENE.NODE_351_length_2365_cov_46.875782_g328_i0~~NODE_351_length_2365_cov_46.875782_g328_i0.p1  ORF type:complete len:734 (+),score=187.62 NODE_351_length_2365_cov_46.875782_g328_i0:50-2251(+)
MEYDEGQNTTTYVGAAEVEEEFNRDALKRSFNEFIRLFRRENCTSFHYHEELKKNVHTANYFLEINVSDLISYDARLQQGLADNPGLYLPLFEEACKEAAQPFFAAGTLEAPSIQIILYWAESPTLIRNLLADRISKLICIPGLVINASKTKCKVINATLQCRSCKGYHRMPIPANQQLLAPMKCQSSAQTGTEKCQNNPYQIIPNLCTYVDQQFLKLQELHEDVPTGELPRHISLHLDRYLCDRVQPGKRVTVVGIQTLAAGKVSSEGRKAAGIRKPFVRAVGIFLNEADPATGQSRHSSRAQVWRPEDESAFLQLSKQPDLYSKISRSIDPAIFGLEDTKKAISCQLFGGTRKLLPDGSKLRGDINILLIGDPSTAKSQLLKYTHKVAPIGVYTSGKGSSAAGLTATVIRDSQGDFYLEGGALVLADGGIVCIDEFDKMGQDDRVAIHEAMEQQTISIAKAGITTVLNSRASVLAAANPKFGSYDPLKTTEDQIDFQSTILTRFDLIFKILDPRDPQRDVALAKHVIGIHKSGGSKVTAAAMQQQAQEDGLLDIPTLKSYIDFCKHKCFPTLNTHAKQALQDFYVQAKKNANQLADGASGSARGTISITVRQLEAIIRITESLAKMHLRQEATQEDVMEAIRLFRVSTMDAISSGLQELQMDGDQADEIRKVETAIRRRLGIDTSIPYARLFNEFIRQGFEPFIIERALVIMTKREEIEWKQQRKLIQRKK